MKRRITKKKAKRYIGKLSNDEFKKISNDTYVSNEGYGTIHSQIVFINDLPREEDLIEENRDIRIIDNKAVYLD